MKDVSFLVENGIDVKGSLELFGDMNMYNETVSDFLNSVPKKLSDIKKYKEASDMPNYAILVHSLKSDSKYLGFTKLAELAYNHEMKSKANDITYVYTNYDELMREANRIVNVVKEYMGMEIEQEEEKPVIVKDKTILVVDDSNIIRNFIKKIFNDTYEVIVANDGREAIDAISLNPNSNIVGMLLDLNMPNVDGFQVLDYFKQANLFSRIPVAIITGEGTQNNIQKAYQYPIVDMLQKPFNEVNVKNIVDKLIMIRNMNNH